MVLPCGHCKGCKIARSREWAFRIMSELDTYNGVGCFITLTYSDDNIPENGTLRKKDYQDFMKRLRAYYSDIKLKYYMCGEYGDKFGRPHYHAILFGLNWFDFKRFWPYGYVKIGSVTFDSARYVSGYIDKKYGVKKNKEVYENFGLIPPYQAQSQGLGLRWAQAHPEKLEHLTLKGKPVGVPRYFVKKGLAETSSDGLLKHCEMFRKWKETNDGTFQDFEKYLESCGKQSELSSRIRVK